MSAASFPFIHGLVRAWTTIILRAGDPGVEYATVVPGSAPWSLDVTY
jgi:hypothetical protein